MVDESVARKAVPMMAVGSLAPAAAMKATVLAGTKLDRTGVDGQKGAHRVRRHPGRGLSFSRSCMARSPSGVAALPRPSILAAMFISIEPMAGWVGGTSGKSLTIIGPHGPG